jgi:hypothetical protein
LGGIFGDGEGESCPKLAVELNKLELKEKKINSLNLIGFNLSFIQDGNLFLKMINTCPKLF